MRRAAGIGQSRQRNRVLVVTGFGPPTISWRRYDEATERGGADMAADVISWHTAAA
jgi:hypothetical protein